MARWPPALGSFVPISMNRWYSTRQQKSDYSNPSNTEAITVFTPLVPVSRPWPSTNLGLLLEKIASSSTADSRRPGRRCALLRESYSCRYVLNAPNHGELYASPRMPWGSSSPYEDFFVLKALDTLLVRLYVADASVRGAPCFHNCRPGGFSAPRQFMPTV